MKFPVSWKKNDIHPRKHSMSSDRKIEDDGKACSVKYVSNHHLDLYAFFKLTVTK